MAGKINLDNELLETTFATLVMMSRLLDKIESKRVDKSESSQSISKQKLLESVMAGIAAMQKEIDDLRGVKVCRNKNRAERR